MSSDGVFSFLTWALASYGLYELMLHLAKWINRNWK